MTTTHLHSQYPTARLTNADYETLMVHLGEQLTAAMLADGWPEDDAASTATDALANTCQDDDAQTVLDWLTAAGRALGVSTAGCVGV